MTMRKSKIGYKGIGADGRPVDWYYSWEPCGYEYSAGCDGCWARRQAKRQRKNCPDCADFKVHLHRERLDEPRRTKKPGIVLTCFHGELFDPERPPSQITDVLLAAAEAEHHSFVWLTNQPRVMLESLEGLSLPDDWYFGLSVRSQGQLPLFLTLPARLWLSVEPLRQEISFDEVCENIPLPFKDYIRGVIVGHDNRRGAPGTNMLDHVRDVVRQCYLAGVCVFVKQLWLWYCPRCRHYFDVQNFADEHNICPRCNVPMKYKLCRDAQEFPPYLRSRALPWSMPKG